MLTYIKRLSFTTVYIAYWSIGGILTYSRPIYTIQLPASIEVNKASQVQSFTGPWFTGIELHGPWNNGSVWALEQGFGVRPGTMFQCGYVQKQEF